MGSAHSHLAPCLDPDYELQEEWSPWSPCSGSCGSGQRRTQPCGTPALPPSPAPATCPRPSEMSPSACRGSGLHCLSLVQGGLGRGEPGSSQTWWSCHVPGGCGHHEPSEGWRPPGAQTCSVAPPAWPPLFPKAPRTKDPLGFPSERWQPLAMLWTRSAQVSVGCLSTGLGEGPCNLAAGPPVGWKG